MSVTRFKSKDEMIVAEDGGYVLYEHYAALTLTWREAKPTVPGLYLYRIGELVEAAKVSQYADGYPINCVMTNGDRGLVEFFGGEWAGPLVLPREK